MPTIFYYLGISLLFTHEMDAVMQTEWRLLLILRDMTDEKAYPLFVALHVPAFFMFLWLGHHPKPKVQARFRQGASLFLIVHAVIHFYITTTPENTFVGVLSNSLIYAAALCGLFYLLYSRRLSSIGAGQ